MSLQVRLKFQIKTFISNHLTNQTLRISTRNKDENIIIINYDRKNVVCIENAMKSSQVDAFQLFYIQNQWFIIGLSSHSMAKSYHLCQSIHCYRSVLCHMKFCFFDSSSWCLRFFLHLWIDECMPTNAKTFYCRGGINENRSHWMNELNNCAAKRFYILTDT